MHILFIPKEDFFVGSKAKMIIRHMEKCLRPIYNAPDGTVIRNAAQVTGAGIGSEGLKAGVPGVPRHQERDLQDLHLPL
jgi:hypothetical protein